MESPIYYFTTLSIFCRLFSPFSSSSTMQSAAQRAIKETRRRKKTENKKKGKMHRFALEILSQNKQASTSHSKSIPNSKKMDQTTTSHVGKHPSIFVRSLIHPFSISQERSSVQKSPFPKPCSLYSEYVPRSEVVLCRVVCRIVVYGFVSCSLRKKVKKPTQMPSWKRRQIQNQGCDRPSHQPAAKLGKVGPGPTELRPSARAMMVAMAPTHCPATIDHVSNCPQVFEKGSVLTQHE